MLGFIGSAVFHPHRITELGSVKETLNKSPKSVQQIAARSYIRPGRRGSTLSNGCTRSPRTRIHCTRGRHHLRKYLIYKRSARLAEHLEASFYSKAFATSDGRKIIRTHYKARALIVFIIQSRRDRYQPQFQNPSSLFLHQKQEEGAHHPDPGPDRTCAQEYAF